MQDKVQLTPNFTVDLDAIRPVQPGDFGVAREPAGERRVPPSGGDGVVRVYNHFYVPPPIENVLASSAGLTSLVSEIGRPLPPVRAIKENQFELGRRNRSGGS